jgi:Zn-dependent M28 family amino/carboxypeptidase
MLSRSAATSLLLTLVTLSACSGDGTSEQAAGGGLESITESDIAEHVRVLASDEFGGRAPSSPGEELTVNYIAEQFAAAGLQPGNDGGWFQNVPLVDITADPSAAPFVVDGSGSPLRFDYSDDFVTWTTRVVEASSVHESELVFVGYGIVAPEVGWNDYEGLDARGKTVVILVNDPGYATQDPERFSGNAMTYYGRWTYKYAEAARQGAAAALIVHQTAPAAYGWETVRNSWTGPQFNLQSPDGNADNLAIEGWISEETTRALFGRAGLDFDELATRAQSGSLDPVAMGLTLSTSVSNTLRFSESRNVIGILPGSEAPDEYFVYMAHWDHFGTDEALVAAGEDGIYNGAYDNASGTAAMLELAEAYASRSQPPRRSIVFLAVTAEEQGLLGSAHYAADPVFPLSKTVAGLNMDGLGNFGPTNDLVVAGYGMSELDPIAEQAAASQDRRIVPDPEPEKGYYFRSDHFELAKMGVPMIYPEHGIDHVERGEEYGREMNARYNAERYHMVTDEFDDTWDLTGAVADVHLYYQIGAAVIDSDLWPNWNEGTEFRAIRDASVASRGGR